MQQRRTSHIQPLQEREPQHGHQTPLVDQGGHRDLETGTEDHQQGWRSRHPNPHLGCCPQEASDRRGRNHWIKNRRAKHVRKPSHDTIDEGYRCSRNMSRYLLWKIETQVFFYKDSRTWVECFWEWTLFALILFPFSGNAESAFLYVLVSCSPCQPRPVWCPRQDFSWWLVIDVAFRHLLIYKITLPLCRS